MRGIHYIVIFSFLIMPKLGLAQFACDDVFAPKLNLSITFEGDFSSEQKITIPEQLKATFSLIRANLPELMSLPEKLNITLEKNNRRRYGGFSPPKMQINLGDIFTGESSNFSSHTRAYASLLHEAGHAVFENSIIGMNPFLEKVRTHRNALDREQGEVAMLHHEERSEAQKEQYRKRLNEIDLEKAKIPQLGALYSVMHELFADFFAATISGEPRLNVRLTDSKEYLRTMPRDLTVGYSETTIREWQENLASIDYWGRTLYFAMAPAKWRIWDLVHDDIKTSDGKKRVLGSLISAISGSMDHTYQKYHLHKSRVSDATIDDYLKELSLLEINNELIARFEATYKK